MRALVLILLFATGAAHAATAFLVSSRTSTSVTGQLVWVCTYQYGSSTFERVYPGTQMCPMSVEVY